GKASAPAKVILFGEHFVVYGSPAILAAINKRISVDARIIIPNENRIVVRSDIGVAGEYNNSNGEFNALEGGSKAKALLDPLYGAIRQVLLLRNQKNIGIEIGISSRVPPGIGLGSSAASCVATVAAVDSLFEKNPSRQKVCKLAIESERLIHKRTSGADCHVSTFGGLMQYYGKSKSFKNIQTKESLSLVVASTGIKHSTSELVVGVKRFKDTNRTLFESLSKQASDICLQARAALESGRCDKIGELMNENQIILQQIGISHHKVQDIIDICNKAGAIGAKITGAGGGGAVIALAASKQESTKIASHIKTAGYQSFEVQIDYNGLYV
ncbi:MAG: mevalonate kinase, partial [Thermoproteota archaeon]|nr:mevalonate kinase [Thermoproteota archaeon]